MNKKIKILFIGEIFNIKNSHLISNDQNTNITKQILKVLFGKNINFCWSFKKKFFWKFEESKCSSFYGKIKCSFDKHINISTKKEISKNKTYYEKVYDLSSPTIPHFQLNLKNSQSYDHFKKSSKRCVGFFVHNCIWPK